MDWTQLQEGNIAARLRLKLVACNNLGPMGSSGGKKPRFEVR